MSLLVLFDSSGGVVDADPVIDAPAVYRTGELVDQALSRLIQQYQDSPRIKELIRILVEPLEELEGVCDQMLVAFDLDTATGTSLDAAAAEVGQLRLGHDDDSLRTLAQARAVANWSEGTASDLIEVAGILAGAGLDKTYSEPGRATAVIEMNEPGHAVSPSIIAEFLRLAKAAGVRVFFIFLDQAETDTLTFATGATREVDAARGYADAAKTTGGAYAGVVAA